MKRVFIIKDAAALGLGWPIDNGTQWVAEWANGHWRVSTPDYKFALFESDIAMGRVELTDTVVEELLS